MVNFSFCSPRDNYSKEFGKNKAVERLTYFRSPTFTIPNSERVSEKVKSLIPMWVDGLNFSNKNGKIIAKGISWLKGSLQLV
jgi:hypothetical protein